VSARVTAKSNSDKAATAAAPSAPSASGIRDNYKRGLVADFLRTRIKDGSKLSVVSAYFTIYAFDALKDWLTRIDSLDFLFGEPRFLQALDPDRTEKKSFIIDPTGLQLANRLEMKRVARECAAWIREKVAIRSVRQANLLHGKMYHVGLILPKEGFSQATGSAWACRLMSAPRVRTGQQRAETPLRPRLRRSRNPLTEGASIGWRPVKAIVPLSE
jgi:hypothetical protein